MQFLGVNNMAKKEKVKIKQKKEKSKKIIDRANKAKADIKQKLSGRKVEDLKNKDLALLVDKIARILNITDENGVIK